MKKKELKELPVLRATKKMMELARADKFMMRPQRHGGWVETYERGFYLRGRVFGDILKVAVYLTEYIRMGVREAAFEVYVDKERDRFLTYDRMGDRWLTAKVDCLPWPGYIYRSTGYYVSEHSAKAIQRYFGGAHGGYVGLLEYQQKVRKAVCLFIKYIPGDLSSIIRCPHRFDQFVLLPGHSAGFRHLRINLYQRHIISVQPAVFFQNICNRHKNPLSGTSLSRF